MDNLTPITREEMLMNDETLTPITREEKILAGEDLNPVTRREYFLKKYRHAGGDVMVEGLSVTENGTYTAPEGKAYSPVEVAVPLPDNAYLLKEASGSLVSFNDGADLPMPSFVCKIEAVQSGSGDPSPENVRPISGHTGVDAWVRGKNLLPMTVDGIKAANTAGTWSGNSYTANDVTFKIQTDYDSNVIGITVDTNGGTASADVIFYLSADSNRGFSLLQGVSYIVTADGATNNVGVRIGDSTDAYVGMVKPNPLTFTADSSNTARIGVNNGLSISNVTIKPMIRLATDTDPTYEPYNPNSQTIQVSWQTEAGEVYGGYVDLVSGVLTVTHKGIDIGTLSWGIYPTAYNDRNRFRATLSPTAVNSDTTIGSTSLCSSYKLLESGGTYSTEVDGYTIVNSMIYMYVDKYRESTSTKFKSAMDGVQLVYELATPITYQLTPQQIKSLLGNNNAWCSTGDVDIDYFAKEV